MPEENPESLIAATRAFRKALEEELADLRGASVMVEPEGGVTVQLEDGTSLYVDIRPLKRGAPLEFVRLDFTPRGERPGWHTPAQRTAVAWVMRDLKVRAR